MIRLFASYLSERFRLSIFGPAIALHVAAALWANNTTSVLRTIVPSTVLTTSLMVQFRLWDDLEDREHDRVLHPHRLVVRTEAAPLRRMLSAISLMNLALMAASSSLVAITGLILLDLFFLLAYRWIRPRTSDAFWRFQILLLKYPAFVILVAGDSPKISRLTAAALAIFACACAYEALHERQPALGAAL